MPRRRRRGPQSASSDIDQVVRGATRARHGGSNTARLINVGGALRLKRQLSEDYRREPGAREQLKLAQKAKPEANVLPDSRIEQEAVKALHHFVRYGDSGQLTTLIQSVRSRVKRERLVRWCIERAPLRWDADNARFRKLKGTRQGSSQANPLGPAT